MVSCFCLTVSSGSKQKSVWRRRTAFRCETLRPGWWGWRSHRKSEPVISIHQVQPGVDGAGDCLWQKGILMGEKCELPDFSGAIVYDSAGNLAGRRPPLLLTL